MLKDEASELAKAEYSILHAWRAATPTAQKNHRPREIENLVEYYWHLNFLIQSCERGFSSSHGYAATLSEQALKQWAQNAKPDCST